MEGNRHKKVEYAIPDALGYLSCLHGSYNSGNGLEINECKLVLNKEIGNYIQAEDNFRQKFWCSKCDRSNHYSEELFSKIGKQHTIQSRDTSIDFDLSHLRTLFFDLLYNESSEEVQVSCVQNLRRILVHEPSNDLIDRGSEWCRCVKYLLLNGKKAIREAFCSQISSFLSDSVLSCLFYNVGTEDKSNEQNFMDIIKHALATTEDPQIFETLLESTAEIMVTVDMYNQLFLFSLILLVDQLDNIHVTVRTTASRLIHKSCCFHLRGGVESVLSKVVHVRHELYDYLSARFSSRTTMIREFAEAVLGVETEELVKRMIPDVLPKLVVSQQDNEGALNTLYELATCLNTDLVPLIVNWLPRVLAFVLHRADEQELLSALQFYQAHIGSDKQEIFAAALPALLDELVCFLDGADSAEVSTRYISELIHKFDAIIL